MGLLRYVLKTAAAALVGTGFDLTLELYPSTAALLLVTMDELKTLIPAIEHEINATSAMYHYRVRAENLGPLANWDLSALPVSACTAAALNSKTSRRDAFKHLQEELVRVGKFSSVADAVTKLFGTIPIRLPIADEADRPRRHL